MAIIKLKDWDERPNKEDDVNAVIGQIYCYRHIKEDAQIFAEAWPIISRVTVPRPVSPWQPPDKAGGELSDFYNVYLQFIGALNQRPRRSPAQTDLQHQLPAVYGGHRRCEGQARRIADFDIL